MIESTSFIVFLIILPIVSLLYSSVGHGGASGYLALMVIFSFPSEIMKSTALLLNLFVAGIAFYQYYNAGHFNKKLFIYFAIGSIPAAFFGGKMDINPDLYRQILGVLLIFAIVRMLWKSHQETRISNPYLIITIAALLISKLPTFSLKKITIPRKLTIFILLGVGIVFVSLIFFTFESLFILGVGYLLLLPVSFVIYKNRNKTSKISSNDDGHEDIL